MAFFFDLNAAWTDWNELKKLVLLLHIILSRERNTRVNNVLRQDSKPAGETLGITVTFGGGGGGGGCIGGGGGGGFFIPKTQEDNL